MLSNSTLKVHKPDTLQVSHCMQVFWVMYITNVYPSYQRLPHGVVRLLPRLLHLEWTATRGCRNGAYNGYINSKFPAWVFAVATLFTVVGSQNNKHLVIKH